MRMKIVADSSANLLTIDNVDFKSVPLTINAGDKEFVDDETLDLSGMVNFMKNYKGKSGTACPGVGDWLDSFEGADVIFCFTISSKLSGSYNSALTAKQQFEEEHPDKKVYLVDTLTAGPMMKLIVEKTRDLIVEGKDAETVHAEILEYLDHTDITFCLESMNNLANNGRVSMAAATFAAVLGIRAVGDAVGGVITARDKCRGEKKAIAGILKNMEELGYCGGRVYVDHCENLETAKKLEAYVKEKYPTAEFTFGVTRGLCSFYAEKGGLMIGYEH